MPLYRLEQIFARGGVELSRKTMCDWIGNAAELLQPIVQEQKKWLLETRYLQGDESPVQVMDPTFPGRTRRGWLAPEAKVTLRRKESVPILGLLELAIREAAKKVLPESLLGKVPVEGLCALVYRGGTHTRKSSTA